MDKKILRSSQGSELNLERNPKFKYLLTRNHYSETLNLFWILFGSMSPSSVPGHVTFSNALELNKFAKLFLVDCRLPSLDYDVRRCLRMESAGYCPFPAIMYCFSMIDLLGALHAGCAHSSCATVSNSTNYMKKFTIYPHNMIDLLWNKIYRHKLVHLSMPQTAIKHNGKIISWSLHDDNPSNHMSIIPEQGVITIGNNCGSITYDGKFVVNIAKLKEDIIDSVSRPNNGYLCNLQQDIDLQNKFEKAINEIYEVK